MKRLTATICMILLAFPGIHASEPVSFYLQSISIHGQTNINRFTFTLDSSITQEVDLPRQLPSQSRPSHKVWFKIPVKAFQARKPQMRRDFQKMLQASRYPNIRVAIDKEELIEILKGLYPSDLQMKLSLAGHSDSVRSQYNIKQTSPNQLLLKGLSSINLYNFQLTPPQKMLGLVEVKQTILIKFDMVLSYDQAAFRNKTD